MVFTSFDIAIMAVLALSIACMVVGFVKRGRCPLWLVVLGLVPPLSAAAALIWASQTYEGEAWTLAVAAWPLLAAALLLVSIVKAGMLRRLFVRVGLAMCGVPAVLIFVFLVAVLLDPPSIN